jgi:hypothetical protein
MRKRLLFSLVVGLVAMPAPALACAGLFDPNGAVKLGRTATFAGHHNGVEHYVTAFKYSGGGGEFGSVVPLPGMVSKVEKGGDWTLQRLLREVEPQRENAAFAAAAVRSDDSAQEVYKTRIEALDITVLKGGGRSVGLWAAQHGFRLPPDAPEVLDFYAARSPYFMAAVFDTDAAKEKGEQIGDATTIHITIPLADPWVPLRILGLGKTGFESVDADVFLLTDRLPNLLPLPGHGYTIERQVPASKQLLADLRSDRGMSWIPESGMTLSHLQVNSNNPQLRYDLATNVHGGQPSAVLAGLEAPPTPAPKTPPPTPKPTPQPTLRAVGPLTTPFVPASTTRSAGPLVAAVLAVLVSGVVAWAARRRLIG